MLVSVREGFYCTFGVQIFTADPSSADSNPFTNFAKQGFSWFGHDGSPIRWWNQYG